ncbi:MAG: hypothetical protein ACRCXZ_02490 [Patescibacteria group bacterium]
MKISFDYSTSAKAYILFEDGAIWRFSRIYERNEKAYQELLTYCS